MERTPEPVSDMLLPLQLLARCGATTRSFCAKTQRDRVQYQYMIPSFVFANNLKDVLGKVVNYPANGQSVHAPLSPDEVKTDSSGRVRLPSDCRTIGNFETRFEYVCVWVRTRFAISQAGVQPKKHSRITNSQRRRMDSFLLNQIAKWSVWRSTLLAAQRRLRPLPKRST
jgi:hypothetical protein